MRYVITRTAENKIKSFYRNVAKKYKNTFSEESMHKNIDDTINNMLKIENGLPRRVPTIDRWRDKGFMANTRRWYYLYRIDGDVITVIDACHSQNMKESFKRKISRIISEVIYRHLYSK